MNTIRVNEKYNIFYMKTSINIINFNMRANLSDVTYESVSDSTHTNKC